MLAHLVARLAYVGLSCGQCGPSLELCGGLSWAMLAHLGAMLTYLGAMWRGYVGPILGLCWPILGLRWSILGLSWPILVAMLAHLGGYVGASLAGGRGRRQGRRPLSPTERRELPYGNAMAMQGAPGRIKGSALCRRPLDTRGWWPNQIQAKKQCRTRMPPGKLVRDGTATPTTLLASNLLASFCRFCSSPTSCTVSGPQCQTSLSEVTRNHCKPWLCLRFCTASFQQQTLHSEATIS